MAVRTCSLAIFSSVHLTFSVIKSPTPMYENALRAFFLLFTSHAREAVSEVAQKYINLTSAIIFISRTNDMDPKRAKNVVSFVFQK